MLVAARGRLDIVSKLIDSGANVDATDKVSMVTSMYMLQHSLMHALIVTCMCVVRRLQVQQIKAVILYTAKPVLGSYL